MTKTLAPTELYERINNLFIEICDIQENTIKELKAAGVSEEAARILTNTVIKIELDDYFGGLNKWN